MNFADESYVRVYKRRTATMAVVGWQARAVLRELLLVVDKAGVIDMDADDHVGSIAALIDVPEEIVGPALDRLEAKGCIRRNGTVLVIPRFREAQETPASDRLRAKETRERRRSDAMSATQPNAVEAERHEKSHAVTPRHAASRAVTSREETQDLRDESSRNVTDPSRNVTERHEKSHAVTPRHAASLRAEQSRSEQESPPTPSESERVPCPRGLALDSDQRATLEMRMPGWAIDELTARFVAKAIADKRDRKTLEHWSKCLVIAISGDWNDPRKRPRRDEDSSASKDDDPLGLGGRTID